MQILLDFSISIISRLQSLIIIIRLKNILIKNLSVVLTKTLIQEVFIFSTKNIKLNRVNVVWKLICLTTKILLPMNFILIKLSK